MWIQVVNACVSVQMEGQALATVLFLCDGAVEVLERNDEGRKGTLADCGKARFLLKTHCNLGNHDVARTACRMLKMAVQRGRSE